MKKKLAVLLSTVMVTLSAVSAFGADGVIKDGRTLVPVRGVFESLGFAVNWDSATNKASISDGTHEVSVIKGMSYFKADGKEIYPDVPQQIIDGSLYLPLRAIGDAVGANTSWDNENKVAHISYNGKDVYVKCSNNATSTSPSSGEYTPSPIASALNGNLASVIALNRDAFAKAAHSAVKYESANIFPAYGGLKYPNTATFQDEESALGIWGAEEIDYSSTVGKQMRSYGVTQKYECYYDGYVTSQLPTGLMKQVSYSVSLVFDLDENNKPINIQSYFCTLFD